jgi:hypothetical protein
VLTPYTGPTNISTAGTVINDAAISNGCLYVSAPNVTIENSTITGLGCFGAIHSASTGLIVHDVTIDGLNQDPGGSETYGIFGDNWSAQRVNIDHISEPLNGCHDVSVTDSWVHDLYVSSITHNEDLYCGGTSGGTLTVRHNSFANQATQTATVYLAGDFSGVQNVTVDDNLLNGAGYTIYGGHIGAQDANIKITNNHFMRLPQVGAFWLNGGEWGPMAYFQSASPGNVWSGNVWNDNGASIPAGG